MVEVSVIVCTYNRSALLASALESLCRQSVHHDRMELLVIDNASCDGTREMVQDFMAKFPKQTIRYIYEPQQGLGHARNRGVREAVGCYVAFIDDDAQAKQDWLEAVLDCFENVRPSPVAIGGPILPLYDSPKPGWFKDEYEVRTWGVQPRLLMPGESFSGSNMVFRKEVLEAYGGFDTRVGVKGGYLSVGEETGLFEKMWIKKVDAIFYYSPRIVVFHAVPTYKATVSYQLKRAFATGQAWFLRHGTQSLQDRLRLLLGILRCMAASCGSALVHNREYATYQNWMVERLAPVVVEMGRLAGCLGFVISVKQG